MVDLDPYGTPSAFLDTAVQAVTDGGILLVTATDMANLCGNNSTACFSNYGAYPVHRPYCHEMALRILLGCIEVHANRWVGRTAARPVAVVAGHTYTPHQATRD